MSTVQLSLADLADLVGVSVATLRVWQVRYGFPSDDAEGYGHRDLSRLREVLRRRSDGARLDVAITDTAASY